jgi:hypothetical protein
MQRINPRKKIGEISEMTEQQPAIGALRVSHIPRIGAGTFHVEVQSIEQAKVVIDALKHYDNFLIENKITPDRAHFQELYVYNRQGGDGRSASEWELWYGYPIGLISDITLVQAIEYDRQNGQHEIDHAAIVEYNMTNPQEAPHVDAIGG